MNDRPFAGRKIKKHDRTADNYRLGVATATLAPAVATASLLHAATQLSERVKDPAERKEYTAKILRDAKARGVGWRPNPFPAMAVTDRPAQEQRKAAVGRLGTLPNRNSNFIDLASGKYILTPRKISVSTLAHEAGHSVDDMLPLQAARGLVGSRFNSLGSIAGLAGGVGMVGMAEKGDSDTKGYKALNAATLALVAAPAVVAAPVVAEEIRANKNAYQILRRLGMPKGKALYTGVLRNLPALGTYATPVLAAAPYVVAKAYERKKRAQQEKTAGLPRYLKEMYKSRVAATAVNPKSATDALKWTSAFPTPLTRATNASSYANSRLQAHMAGKSGSAGAPSLLGRVARGSSRMDRRIRPKSNNAMQSYSDFIQQWRNQPPPTIRQRLVEFITDPLGDTQYPRGVKRGTPPPGGWEVSRVGSDSIAPIMSPGRR